MGDLASGAAIVIGVSFALVRVGLSVERRCRRRTANGIALLSVAAVFLYGWLVHGRLILARLVPAANVVVLSNVIPLGAGLVIGIVLARRSIPRWRRVAVASLLGALAGYALLADVVGCCPRAKSPRYDQGLCLQTSPASCSACCAASLLRLHGIPASEKEMIRLCLTRHYGTPPLGLYRGLQLKTRGTAWDVEVFHGSPEDLRQADGWPAILMVRLVTGYRGPAGSEAYGEGPQRPMGHAVLLCAVTENGNALIVDPAEGVRLRPVAILERVWAGEGLRLTRRRTPREAKVGP
jgi:hypothetical protein